MTAPRFEVVRDASAFRRMAAAMWPRPSDPTIHGILDVDAGPALAFLDAHAREHGVKLTVTHLVTRAVALALRDLPELNVKVRFWGRLEQRRSVDLFVTVSTEGGRDLSGARLERVDERPLVDVARELADRAAKIRSGADKDYKKSRSAFARMPWWAAGAATRVSDFLVNELHVDLSSQGMPADPFGAAMITSVGMFGIDTAFAPLLPLARCPMLILVNEVRPRPWVGAGNALEVRPVLRLCASFDHRIVDGAQAGRLARALNALFADPARLA